MIRISKFLENVYRRGVGWLPVALLGTGMALGTSCSSGSPVSTADGTDTPGPALTVNGSRNRFTIIGPEGGPFPEGQRTYEIQNNRNFPIDWEAQSSVPWLRFSRTSGTIPPNRTESIIVSMDGISHSIHPFLQLSSVGTTSFAALGCA